MARSNEAELRVVDDGVALPDGSSARRVGDALELRDGEGRLLVRFCNGELALTAPEGDLKLCAPKGAVVIESATDVALRAGRDIVQAPARRAEVRVGDCSLTLEGRKAALHAGELDVVAQRSQLTTGAARLLARQLHAGAESVVTRVERYELDAKRIVERSSDTFREVSDLLQTKSGRVRSFVDSVYALYSGRTVMVSDKDTSIDGEKVLLG